MGRGYNIGKAFRIMGRGYSIGKPLEQWNVAII